MGKRLITQRRGRGSPRYRSPSHRFGGGVCYPRIDYSKTVGGQVIDLTPDPGRTAPMAKILFEDFSEIMVIAPEGLRVGQWIWFGSGAQLQCGSVMPLSKIPEGTDVYNIEVRPGDGGKLVRSSGTSAVVVSHDRITNLTQIKMPSKKMVVINSNSLASVGKVAGGGRTEKLMAHAGQKYHMKKATGKLYPTVCGRAMNSVDHPHGGGRHPHVGRPTTVSRNTPPGRKVGHIAARRTGLKKRG